MTPPPLLAQASTTGLHDVFLWSGVLVGLALAAFVGYSMLKRWMRSDDGAGGRGFTLADLRDLRRQGKITDAEYASTSALLVGAAKRQTAAMPPVLPRRSTGPQPPVVSDVIEENETTDGHG